MSNKKFATSGSQTLVFNLSLLVMFVFAALGSYAAMVMNETRSLQIGFIMVGCMICCATSALIYLHLNYKWNWSR